MNRNTWTIALIIHLASFSIPSFGLSLGEEIGKYGWRSQYELIRQTSKAHRVIEATPDHLVVATPLPNGQFPTADPMKGGISFQITFIKKSGRPDLFHIDLNCSRQNFSLATPDEKGIFRIIAWNEPMNPTFKPLCSMDFTLEREAAESDIRKAYGIKDRK
jgi:hypothetical protein